jgi:alpha-N-arabinofuranosidase
LRHIANGSAPDYYQSFGLGFFEYFQLCEDIGAEPLPILNCGMACQFNSGELAPLDQLGPYIQDALDLIEFANGPATSAWGRKRAAMGHPQPFHMKMLGVGNEQWHQQYIDRYTAFAKVLKARHPEIKLVASAGPSPDDERFHFAWPRLRALGAEIVDEHCYDRPDWFLNNTTRYDHYERRGPKVFMGEYAAQSDKVVSVENRNNWRCALAEAAYMTGLERNADVVVMASYAPLFGHEEGWQWRPNLIWCDNLRCYGTPNYYVQQLFSRNRGDRLLQIELGGAVPAEGNKPRFYATASRDDQENEVILKVVNASAGVVETSVHLDGVTKAGKAAVTRLSGALGDENSFAAPRKVAPVTTSVTVPGLRFAHRFPPYSVTVLRVAVSP